MRAALLRSMVFILPALVMAVAGWLGTDADTRIPVHWGIDGQPDRWGGRLEAFFLLPAIMIGVSLAFAILPAIDPRGRNLARSRVVLNTAWSGTLALLLVLEAAMLAFGLGWVDADGTRFMPGLSLTAVGILFILLGNVLGKARPNWFVGIRTPWTLSSDLAWDKTHRLVGRLMVLAGLILLAGVWFLPARLQFGLALIAGLAPAVIGTAYSYWVWRNDPTRETAMPDELETEDPRASSD